MSNEKSVNAGTSVAVVNEELETSIVLSEEQAMEVAQVQSEEKGYLDELKFTYQMSGQFADGICKIGQMFCEGMNLGNEIDVWIPTLAYQTTCMDGPAKKFLGKIIFPYTEPKFHMSKKYLEFKEKLKEYPSSFFKAGNMFLMYIPEYDKFCSCFFSGTLVNAGNSLFNLLRSGKGNYIRLKSSDVPGKRYLKVTSEIIAPFPKPRITRERLDKAIEQLMTENREESESGTEAKSTGGR